MPVKRRLSKWRTTIPPGDWDMTFYSGTDFLNELADYGLETDQQVREAAREAWAQHGRAYMATWQPEPEKPLPWAAHEFGLPEGYENAR